MTIMGLCYKTRCLSFSRPGTITGETHSSGPEGIFRNYAGNFIILKVLKTKVKFLNIVFDYLAKMPLEKTEFLRNKIVVLHRALAFSMLILGDNLSGYVLDAAFINRWQKWTQKQVKYFLSMKLKQATHKTESRKQNNSHLSSLLCHIVLPSLWGKEYGCGDYGIFSALGMKERIKL